MKRMRRHILAAVTITAVLLTAVPGAGGYALAQGAQEMAAAADGLLAEQRLNTWYSQAIRSISEEDYENALMCLNGCEPYVSAGDNPTLYADIYLKRGYCLLMQGRQQEALDALDKALKTDPDLSNAQLLKVSAYSDLGEYGKAIAALEKYIRAPLPAGRGDLQARTRRRTRRCPWKRSRSAARTATGSCPAWRRRGRCL